MAKLYMICESAILVQKSYPDDRPEKEIFIRKDKDGSMEIVEDIGYIKVDPYSIDKVGV
jgi:hypothetical protein